MNELTVFVAVILGFFLYESILKVPLDATIVRWGWGGWRSHAPLILRSGSGPAVVLASLLPPLGLVVVGRRGGRLDLGAVQAELQGLVRATRALRVAENALWCGLMGGVLWLLVGSWEHVLWILGGLGGLWGIVIVVGLLTRRKLALRPPWGEVGVALGSPISAIRLHDLYSKRALEGFDGLAIALAVLSRDAGWRLVREAWAQAAHGVDPDGRDLGALEALVREGGWEVEALARPPVREGRFAVAYCPVCWAQYVAPPHGEARVTCASCAGVGLKRFDEAGEDC